MIGLAGFGATSLLCALAPSPALLVAGRTLQGVAGALLVPSSLAIITATFSPGERGAAVGSWTAWTGVSFVAGPLLGGLLIDTVSWRLIFAINLPLVAGTLVLAARAIEERVETRERTPVDLTGAALCIAGLGGPVFALIEEPARGFGHALVLLPLIAGTLALAAFVLHERRTRHPMLPLHLFENRDFTVTNVACLTFYAGLISMVFFVVIFLQQVAGYNALEAGLALTPITLMMFTLSRRFGALAARVGPRLLMGSGPLIAAGGLLMLLRVGRDAPYVGTLLPALLVFGLGLSMTVAPLTATVLASVEQRHAGVASGVNNAIARMGALIGIALVGAVIAARYDSVLGGRLPASECQAAGSRALAGARSLPPAQRARLGPAFDSASESGLRAGLLLQAALVGGGGLWWPPRGSAGREGGASPLVRCAWEPRADSGDLSSG